MMEGASSDSSRSPSNPGNPASSPDNPNPNPPPIAATPLSFCSPPNPNPSPSTTTTTTTPATAPPVSAPAARTVATRTTTGRSTARCRARARLKLQQQQQQQQENSPRLNWSFWETLVLLDAKRQESEEKGGPGGNSKSRQPVSDRWEQIAAFCYAKGVRKSGLQCWHRWDKLWPKFKRILDYEQRPRSDSENEILNGNEKGRYWCLNLAGKKSRGLPDTFSYDLFEAMCERFGPDRVPSSDGPYKFMAEKIAVCERFEPDRVPSSDGSHKFMAEKIVDKISSTSTLDRKANRSSSMAATTTAGEEEAAIVGSEQPFGKKRKREFDPRPCTKEFQDDEGQLAQYIERVETARGKFFEQFVERATTLFRDKVTSDERKMAKICCELNRVADAINNVAATLGANNL